VNCDEEGFTISGDGFPGDCRTNLFASDYDRILAAADVWVVVALLLLLPYPVLFRPKVIEGADEFAPL